MPETTITFDIKFNPSETSYYSMYERLCNVLKTELRKAYYDCSSESDSESDDDAQESIFKPDYKSVDEVLERLNVSSVSDHEEVEIISPVRVSEK